MGRLMLARFFGPRTVEVVEPPTIKAITGPGVGMVLNGTMLSSVQVSPQKNMAAAQKAYTSGNPWVHVAEATVTRRFLGLPYHFENEDGDEWEYDDAPEPVKRAIDLIDHPQKYLDLKHKQNRRQMGSLICRHTGLCGMGYVYLDQQEQLAGTPLGLVYVNPARVWPSTDDNGNLIGWVVDAQDDRGNGGTPYTTDELIPFYLDSPDSGFIASGLYEAVRLKAHITTLADQHTSYILSTGGRLPGVYSPKDGVIEGDAFRKLVAEFRNVASDPQAAKLSIVTQGPMDFTPSASDTSELDLVNISKMNRDDILAVWGVPGSQAGVPAPAGLNSGGTKGFDEAILMQGAVHDRVSAYVETMQTILDRWKALNYTVTLVIEEPTFDDEGPAYDLIGKARDLAMTNEERRALVGLPPLDDEVLNKQILIPLNLVTYGIEPPPPPTPEPGAPVLPAEPQAVPPPPPFGKAAAPRAFLGIRRQVDAKWVPKLHGDLHKTLRTQGVSIAGRVVSHYEHLRSKPRDSAVWWTAEESRRMSRVLVPTLTALAEQVTEEVTRALKQPGKADPFTDAVVAKIAQRVGVRIKDIDTTTIEAVQAAITEAFEQGLSAAEAGKVIESLGVFDEYRSEMIARTETMNTYNAAALTSYGEYDVTEVLAYDGDMDDECASRDGQTYPIEEALDITDHPNGTLDWAPVLAARASLKEPDPALVALTDAVKALAEREQPDTHIHIDGAQVHVDAPAVNVPEQKAVTRTVKRDAAGLITHITEAPDGEQSEA